MKPSQSLSSSDSRSRVATRLAGVLAGGFLAAHTQSIIPPSYAYPANSGDTAKPGFVGKIHVARQDQSFNASIGRANAQLRDELIDNTLVPPAPYLNLVQTEEHLDPFASNPVNADGTFVNSGVINYSISSAAPNDILDGGLFNSATGHTDLRYPGLPGWTDDTYSVAANVNAFAWEELAWLELPAGQIIIGAHAMDAVQIAIHRNDPRDLFRETPVWFDSNGGLQTRTGVLEVQQAGIYGFRIVHTVFGSANSHVEFFTADPADENNRTLVNDSAVPTAVKAYQALTVPSRPYVDSVSPGISSSGIAENAPVQVVLLNLGAHVPVLKVNGSPVTSSSSTVGNRTTIAYTNATGWGPAKTVTVSIEYAGATGSWSFQTKTGLRALVVGLSAGDTQIAQRLASQFGMDVDNLPEGTVSANSANNPDFDAGVAYLTNYKMIWNSEAVSSGGARPFINFVRDNNLAVPAINVEGANVADWRLGDGSGNVGGGNANAHSVIITDPASPFAAGLPEGTHRVLEEGTEGQWMAGTGLPETVFGLCGTGLDEVTPPVYAFETGTEGTLGYIHPARRVQFALGGPGMIVNWNENGWAMFDAAVRWVMNLPDEPPKFHPLTRSGAGVVISWTGQGTLEESGSVTGGWTVSGSQANPQTVPATGTKFYRLRQ